MDRTWPPCTAIRTSSAARCVPALVDDVAELYGGRLIPLSRPPTGRLRPAREEDRELVAGWIAAFSAEALPSEPLNAAELAAHRISREMLFLWEDPDPVAMAAWAGKTPNGVRVNLVYTPPPRRRRGYASGCVSEVTRLLLERGNRFCFLFTDLSNPTSNSIYQRLGYRPVCDATDYDFAAPPTRS